jgi:hypothetical protein
VAAEVVAEVAVEVVAAVAAAEVAVDVAAAEVAVVVTADVVTATVPTISKEVGARTTKVSHVTLTHALTEVTEQTVPKNHFKDDQRLVAEGIEAAESVTAELTNLYLLTPTLCDRSI